MLMSWAGEDAETAGPPNLEQEAQRSWAEVRAEGVVHGDERYANLLWNAERQRAMVIDFDRSILLSAAKHKQVMLLAGKKRKRCEEGSRKFSWKDIVFSKDQSSSVTTNL
ncbi:uncharacterized protein PV09_09500 [Verruconis gallopava]|uniref:Protein kinase domain-containing protein n=1 Tax=Verruconis gallopava TaxID=253628 RepID=A0A0D1YDA2_9PEZI|nr:uncharacterized protein PV09_09500 [Verruconis gallopava]KIV98711.1 hypothetical protein PV09_09500 [Verruconis gallopava]